MPTAGAIQALQQQRLLLQLEYQTEKEAYRQQTETIGIGRKVKRGDAWWPLRIGKSYYNSLNQLALEVHRTLNTISSSGVQWSFSLANQEHQVILDHLEILAKPPSAISVSRVW